jgi:indolepyruvate ferredoxin oxidoreductase beta subunit
MKSDIILAGVGGQGILSIAAIIGMAALENKYFIKQAEVHGMSQRGGAVQSHLRISDTNIASDLIPMGKVDLILSVEPMESLRYLPWLSINSWLVTNSEVFVNIENYPDYGAIVNEIKRISNHVIVNAEEIARNAGSVRSSNIVMLGAASGFIPLSIESFYFGIEKVFEKKGKEMVRMNMDAFNAGRIASNEYRNSQNTK